MNRLGAKRPSQLGSVTQSSDLPAVRLGFRSSLQLLYKFYKVAMIGVGPGSEVTMSPLEMNSANRDNSSELGECQ